MKNTSSLPQCISQLRLPLEILQKAPGFVLIAALLLVVVVGLVTTTVLETTSTEIMIGGNFRVAVQNLYWAEAGMEEARFRLRGNLTQNPQFIGDPIDNNPLWTAYLLTSSTWSPQQDADYSAQATNYIPSRFSPENREIVANSLNDFLYWVKVKHKTEFDAEQLGHRRLSPHYMDADGSFKRHRNHEKGHVIYYGYPTQDSNFPIQFTSGDSVWAFPVEIVRAFGGLGKNTMQIEGELVHPPGPQHYGALVASESLTLRTLPLSVNGTDGCGVLKPVSPVYSPEIQMALQGTSIGDISTIPASPPIPLNLQKVFERLKRGGEEISLARLNGGYVSSQKGNLTFWMKSLPSFPDGNRVIHEVNGRGMLLVQGDLVLSGPVQWKGLVVVTETLTLEKKLHVEGMVLAKNIIDRGGHLAIQYHSCYLKEAFLAKPLNIVRWKEEF